LKSQILEKIALKIYLRAELNTGEVAITIRPREFTVDAATGAMLPSITGYTSYYVGEGLTGRRLVVGDNGTVYYSSTHYKHFIPILIVGF